MAKVSSCPKAAELEKLASGRLSPHELDPMVQHLEACAQCLGKVQTTVARVG
jgi:hypothetical protein